MVEYVGLDVSKEATAYCVKDKKGEVLARGKVASDPDALFGVLAEHCLCPDRIVLETGTLSNWLARELCRRGLPVTVIDARHAHAVLRLQHNKTDENDASVLAELAQHPGFYRAVAVKSEQAQRWRILLKARAHLVGQRRSRQNVIRGLLGTLGIRFAKGSGKFARRVRALLVERPDLAVMFAPLLDELAALEGSIKQLDRIVGAEAKTVPACRLLMTVPSVGAVTALAYVATIDDAGRFAKSRVHGGLSGPDLAAQPVRRDGLQRTDLQAGRQYVARPALWRRQQLADPGAARSPLEGLGAPDQEADQPQEGLRRLGPQTGGGHAPHADHRPSLRLAGRDEGGRNSLEQDNRSKRSASADRLSPPGRRPRPNPPRWLLAGQRPRLRLIPWDALPIGHYRGASRDPSWRRLRRQPCSRRATVAKKVQESLTRRTELDNQLWSSVG